MCGCCQPPNVFFEVYIQLEVQAPVKKDLIRLKERISDSCGVLPQEGPSVGLSGCDTALQCAPPVKMAKRLLGCMNMNRTSRLREVIILYLALADSVLPRTWSQLCGSRARDKRCRFKHEVLMGYKEKAFQSGLPHSRTRVMWSILYSWTCLEEEVGLEISQGLFQPDLFCEHKPHSVHGVGYLSAELPWNLHC